MNQTGGKAEHRLLCLPLNEVYYAFELQSVIETARDVLITPIPCLPTYYCGVCNRKGSITPVVSLERLADMPENEACAHPVTVMVRAGGYECGIRTETPPVILDVADAQPVYEARTDHTGQKLLIRQIFSAEDGIVLVVDAEATLEGLVVCK